MRRIGGGSGVGLAAVVSALVLGGCVDLKQELLVMPDGSGKIKVTVGVNEEALQGALGGGFGGTGGAGPEVSGRTDINMKKLREDIEGFVAFTEPRQYRSRGWSYDTVTAYFENINKVRISETHEPGAKETELSFSFKPEGGGYVLVVKGGLLGESAPGGTGGGGDAPPEYQAMMAEMLKGFKVLETYRMPGNVTRIEGLTAKTGRTATLSVGEKTMADPKAAKAANLSGTKKIWCDPGKVSRTEQSEFRAEMRRAKAAWARIKRNADKAEAKAKKESEPFAGAAIPDAAATGQVRGTPFTVERAEIRNGILKLRQGKDFFADQAFTIFLFMKKGESLDGRTFKVTPQSSFGSPHIHLSYKVEGEQLPKTDIVMKGYTMLLEFGRAQGKKLPGRIRLSVPAEKKSRVAGTFVAEIKD